jgi:hypothetical protein
MIRACCTLVALLVLSLVGASHAAAQRKTGGATRAQTQSSSDARAKKRGATSNASGAARGKTRGATATPAAPAKPEAKAPTTAPADKPASDKAASDKAADKGHAATAPNVGAVSDAPVPDSGEVHTEGDTQVKMMEFGGLDIEGQLKTPQMLYFLNRLRAEFGHPRLPHRSFMPELEQSTKGKAF